MSQISVHVHRVRSAEQKPEWKRQIKTSAWRRQACSVTAPAAIAGGPPTLQERNLLFYTRSTGQAKQRITSKTPNLRPEVGLCLPVAGDGKMTSSLKCSSETRGNCTAFVFVMCLRKRLWSVLGTTCWKSRFNLFLLFSPSLFIAISQSFLPTLDYSTRKEVKEEGRKEEGRKEGRKEGERTKWKMDGCIIG